MRTRLGSTICTERPSPDMSGRPSKDTNRSSDSAGGGRSDEYPSACFFVILVLSNPQDSLETLQYKLQSFLHWYNYEKRHRGLGMDGLTPFQKLLQLALKNVDLTLQCNKVLTLWRIKFITIILSFLKTLPT